jgi:hypothetical protein
MCVTSAHRVTKTAEIMAVPISSSALATRIQYCHWFHHTVPEGVHV